MVDSSLNRRLDTPDLAHLLRCPDCKGGLQYDPDGASLNCGGCASSWPVRSGIPSFLREKELPDYGLASGMQELVDIARQKGWLAALETHLQGDNHRKEYVREYVASEARADFGVLLSTNRHSTVLDIGSGWGNISVAFARHCSLVYALDTTLANVQFVGIRAAQEGQPNVVPVMGDATRLPLPPESCDVVLMVGVLEWIPWGREDGSPQELQLRALKEAYTVLKPAGQLYIGIENRFSFKYFFGAKEPHTGLRFVSLLPRIIADIYSRRTRKLPFREWTYSRTELRRLLAQAGFRDPSFFYPIPSYQNIRYITDFGKPQMTRFLMDRFFGHGNFTEALHIASHIATAFRIERQVSPCFSVVARKPND